MTDLTPVLALLFFPGGLSLLGLGLVYEWAQRKLLARWHNRLGPRWFQPAADVVKLLAKEEIIPTGVEAGLFVAVPVIALASVLTAALYVPLWGLAPAFSFPGDMVVTIYLLSVLTVCVSLAGANTPDRFARVGATRALTQLFAYEAPFLLALLTPALLAGSWQLSEVLAYTATHWLIATHPISFLVAVIGLMGKLDWPPFDAPEADTEIVAGSFTEYSGRGLALFRLARQVALVVGLTLIAALYLGGRAHPIVFAFKTVGVLLGMSVGQVLVTRLRIDQTVGVWWRWGAVLALGQVFITGLWVNR